MLTIINGIILKGLELTPSKENILIDNGRIVEISKDVHQGKVIDAEGCIVSPSFLNAHTHIGDSIIKDEGDSLSLDEIVKPPNGIKHVALAKANNDDIIHAMKISMWDMLQSGTTHFIDYREGGIKGVNLLIEASKDIPIKPIILARDDSFYGEYPNLNLVKSKLTELLKVADGIGLSGFGEITDEVANLITSECNKQGKISSIHVAESKNAQLNSIKMTGKTEILRAIDANFNQIVHCTNAMGDDIDKIVESKINVTLCPRANASLSVGIPSIKEMLNNGIKPLIGSDNLMLNSPNIMRDLEFSLKLMRAYYKTYQNPLDILKFATTNMYNMYDKIFLSNVGKSIIDVGQIPQLIISKSLSKNPYLSLINRCETKNILYVINKDIIINYNAE